jgi:glutaredoxin-like YruB-family protein
MEVKIYSTPTCPYCRKAKEFLKSIGTEYTDINVAADISAADEMVRVSGQMGVPVIVIGEEVIVGFNENAIREKLEKE